MSKSHHNPPEAGLETNGDRDEFRDRHPGLAPITYAADDNSFKGRLRRHFRNPPMRTVIVIVLLAMAIPIAIAYPRVSDVARENWSDVQLSRERHFVNVTAASWIYPFLKRQAERMQEADIPIEWRGISFTNGPCLAEHMDQLPVGKYGYAIRIACESLHTIQTNYAADCAETSSCHIPEQAVFELQGVLDRLKVAFSDANLVQPYPEDAGQLRD
ncbi:MAG: hypothetical protein QF357_01550 [Dehalococcoidia bacterium]|nr:hypothetical protein [Dehalococcoidia bacterium]